MTKRHTIVEVLDPETVELGTAPDNPETLELTHNGQLLVQDTDYVTGEGDQAAFIKRRSGEPWKRTDRFTATWFVD